MTEQHDDDNNAKVDDGIIYNPRGGETAISSVRLPRACVRILRGRAGDELEAVKKRRRSLSKQQPGEETRCRVRGGAAGDVIGFRRGVLLIPGRNT